MSEDMVVNDELEKERRTKKEVRRLNQIYSTIDENKQKVIKPLIERVAFMTVTLRDLETVINVDGAVTVVTDSRGIDRPAARRKWICMSVCRKITRPL